MGCLALLHVHVPCLLQEEALNWQAAYKARPPTEAIIFIVGGSTYEEAKVGTLGVCVLVPACGGRF
jgi:hypothetical protein